MGVLIRIIAILFAACLVLSALATLCGARTEERYEMISGNTVFGDDFYKSSNIQSLFHQQSLIASDQEQSSVALPNTMDLSTAGDNSVDIALPSIDQNVSKSASADSTGFFSSNYDYRPEAVYGNVPLSTDYPSSLRQAIQPAQVSLTLFSPEQYGTIAIRNKMKELNNTVPSNKPSNETKTNETKSNETGIAINSEVGNSSAMNLLGSGYDRSNLLNLFTMKTASTDPEEIPLIYPSDFDMAGRDGPVLPNPGIGSFSTNGAGSTGASLTGLLPGNNKTSKSNASGNVTGTEKNLTVAAGASGPQALNYADYNFDATTGQINDMTLVERMWRNAHRGGMMGKAYAGDTAAPIWIDPYPRPYDLPMVDEHWYILQSALNMCVPGTQIMPRYWSLMF